MADLNQLRLVPLSVSVHITVFAHICGTSNTSLKLHNFSFTSPNVSADLSGSQQDFVSPSEKLPCVTEFSPPRIFDAHHGLNGGACSSRIQIHISVSPLSSSPHNF